MVVHRCVRHIKQVVEVVMMRAVAEIVETKKGRHQIVVTEIPYGVNKASLVEKIAELVKDKKLQRYQ